MALAATWKERPEQDLGGRVVPKGTATYRPLFCLGSGNAGAPWVAVATGADGYQRPIVIRRAAKGHQEMRGALVREAQLGSASRHPNVVHVHKLVDTAEDLVLIREYLCGLSLHDMLREELGAVPWPMAARIVADAARGLDQLHLSRLPDGAPLSFAHGALSPKDLFLTTDGITKVIGFGLCDRAGTPSGIAGAVSNADRYIAPETRLGIVPDWRADVFSLGSVLLSLITGDRPSVTSSALPTAATVTVPAPVRDALALMLVPDPTHRCTDLGAVAEMLEQAAIGNGGGHRQCAHFLQSHFGSALETERARLSEALEAQKRTTADRDRSDEVSVHSPGPRRGPPRAPRPSKTGPAPAWPTIRSRRSS